MEERTTGLILRTRPLTESSLIINWLSAEQGRVSTVAKGARRQKSAFRGKLDLFFIAEFSYSRSRRSELHNLKEVKLLQSFDGFRRDVDKLQQASYAAAFIERVTERETPLEETYDLMKRFIAYVDETDWRTESVLWFELQMLHLLGVQPDQEQSGLSPRTRKLMNDLFATENPSPKAFQPDVGEIKELVRFLHGYIIYHFDRLPSGRAAALRFE